MMVTLLRLLVLLLLLLAQFYEGAPPAARSSVCPGTSTGESTVESDATCAPCPIPPCLFG